MGVSGRMMPFGCQGDMAGRGRRMGVWVGSNRGRPKMTGGPNLGHPHCMACMGSRSVRAGSIRRAERRGSSRWDATGPRQRRYVARGVGRGSGLSVFSLRTHSRRARAAHLHGLTCAPAAPRVHQAELPGASRQAAPSPVFTRAVHPVHCRAEAFPSGRRPLMNDIGANEALGPLRTRSARPCGSQTESGPNLEHWKTVATSLRAH